MNVSELIRELEKIEQAGYGQEEVVYLGGEYRHDYKDIHRLHIGRGDRGSRHSIVINGNGVD